jgi:beta-xylosidase
MSFSQPHRYKLYCTAGAWSEEYAQEIGYIHMSSMPSKDQIFNALKGANQFDGLNQHYIDGLLIDRPNGWYYKQIKIYAYGDKNRCIWKFEPAP